ncbi:MAG: acyl carrier protein [Clostridia bacterium]|nr:acyl carrier protein [Clostridia bacterium]
MFEKIRKILCDQFETDEEFITLKTQFEEDLDADYIDMIDLAMTLEDEFSVEVPDEALEKFKTVADVVEFLD